MIEALRLRLADVFNVSAEEVLPLRSALHAKELAMRMAAQSDRKISYARGENLDRLAEIYGVEHVDAGKISIQRFDDAAIASPLALIDESEIEYSGIASSVGNTGVAVIREVGVADGSPCAALIASKELIERFSAVIEPDAMPPLIVKAAVDVLTPSRLAAARARIARTKAARRQLVECLRASAEFAEVREGERASICVTPVNDASFCAAVRTFEIGAEPDGDGRYFIRLGAAAENERLLSAFGVTGIPRRAGEVRRETLETKISAIVDLDQEGEIEISTGVGFFDHMLTQVAHHAGVSVTLFCEGDLEIDPHHTIEDCAIAFGEALSRALGARRGIARFGFLLPMDEAEAKVSVDLGGRPFLVFDAPFKAAMIGEYPTEMTAHVFRSLSQSLNAAIHIHATGENDHHVTEACYKAFGRALRQALRIEGDATPSTKGVI